MVVRYDRTYFSLAESRLLGGHLAAARRAAEVCPGALARRLKIPEATLRAYEAGRARLPVRLVFAAARALDIAPYQLLVGRTDRVLNPWGPSLAEWQRVRRHVGSPHVRVPGEAARALAFLDEPGPARRLEACTDEEW
ncbi:MAG: helix-turn-helix domain-containing protein [Nitrospinota bacterium]